MKRQLVYDLPTRLFHWLFAGLFLSAFGIAKLVESETVLFNVHSLLGITLSFAVVLRLIWGFIGSKHARFLNFPLHPKSLVGYMKGIVTGSKARWGGHNPASSWAALTMIGLTLGLGITGYLMTSGSNKEDFEDIHEILANGFIIVVIAHILGIAVHTFRHRELIGLSMLDGKKRDVPAQQTISSTHSRVGALFLILIAAMGIYLFKNFDANARTVQIFGNTLQLGEAEK